MDREIAWSDLSVNAQGEKRVCGCIEVCVRVCARARVCVQISYECVQSGRASERMSLR